ncbi:hypothetical protein Fcan01_20904 [Folsomia candida]|uniref:Uncharacterized protein n=1 Tax=Folsomia candida TaxID=158441 RepID=A0A226DHY3_FOLCA|nr:hypothetical protein Fcan01_20904 [Folsomia candida]
MASTVVMVHPSIVIDLWINQISRQRKLDTFFFSRAILEQYRVAQVMKNLLNFVKRNPITGLVLSFVIDAEIASFYAITMCRGKLPLPVLLLFAMALLDYSATIFVFLRALGQKLRNLIKSASAPQDSWEPVPYSRILGSYEIYEEARKNPILAEETSNVDIDSNATSINRSLSRFEEERQAIIQQFIQFRRRLSSREQDYCPENVLIWKFSSC